VKRKTIKPYKWKKPPRSSGLGKLNRAQITNVGEELTGIVQGMGASDIEERFAKALDRARDESRIEGYGFREARLAGRNLPGEVELDFAVYSGGLYPFQIDGGIAHKSAEQKEEDAVKDALLNESIRGFPVERVPGHLLETQDMANEFVDARF
jgi:hypothetical protein